MEKVQARPVNNPIISECVEPWDLIGFSVFSRTHTADVARKDRGLQKRILPTWE